MPFTGKTIVVTGGGSGIGLATVQLLRQRGAEVAVIGRSEAALRQLATRTGAKAYHADVGDEAEVTAAFAAIAVDLGPFQGLFCNAGINPPEGLVHDESVGTWDSIIRVNLRGTFLVVREAMKRFVEQGQPAAIVCTSSGVAKQAIPGGTNAYTASKAGVEALVRQVAVDFAARRIRINSVVPGPIDTPLMWATTPPGDVASMRLTIDREVPLGKIGQPIDIAHCVAWLLSEEANYVTGASFVVDGGVSAKMALSA
jgi:NAD(P)-dependent dehydrogenase (short-subunit alcohol dehydrogenase family)